MPTLNPHNNRILIIDDDFFNREVIKNILSSEYTFDDAEDGLEGLQKIESQEERLNAILLDLNMPRLNGIELLRILFARGVTERIPTFLITANDELDIAREAYELGVMDVISKPIVPFIIQRRVKSVIELFQARVSLQTTVQNQEIQLQENANTIDALNRSTIEALASAIEFRDIESGEHTNRIYGITKLLLSRTEMGIGLSAEDIENIAIGSIMHDIGKIAVSDVILNKPGKLTKEEYDAMKLHTVKGAALMEQLTFAQGTPHPAYLYACDIAHHHHERWDGRGYPEGLKGDEISIAAQVVSIADVYDALVSPRVYKQAFSPDKAAAMILGGECGVFNPNLLSCFVQAEPALRALYAEHTDEPAQQSASTAAAAARRQRMATALASINHQPQEVMDVLLLMTAVQSAYDLIISVNLTQNTYHMVDYERFLTHCATASGVFDELIVYGASAVPESHRQLFASTFSRENLLRAYAQGKSSVSLRHPQYGDDGEVHQLETSVLFMKDGRNGDILEITLSRYLDEEAGIPLTHSTSRITQ